MRKVHTISMISLLLLMGCGGAYSPDLNEVSVADKYTLQIPETMQKSNELHDFAALQYHDDEKGIFLIGIEESKSKLRNLHLYYNLEDYAFFVQRTVAGGLDTVNVQTVQLQEINGLKSFSTDMFGALASGDEGLEVYYHLCVLESPTHFYQLISWTSREQYPAYKDVLAEIECSFREIPEDTASNGRDITPGDAAETAGS